MIEEQVQTMVQIRTDLVTQTPASPERRAWRFWPALVTLAVGAIVIAALWLTMPRTPAEGSPEVVFARDMAAHHAQAVEMALIIRDRSADDELRQFALDMTLTQQAQIGQMQGWLAAWSQPLSSVQPPMNGQGEMMGMATQQQVNDLRTLPAGQAEVVFLQLMIRHHQGGVAMAEDVLRQTRRPEVVRLATAIVQGQQSEIAYMEQLLKQRGAAPLAPLPQMNMEHTPVP